MLYRNKHKFASSHILMFSSHDPEFGAALQPLGKEAVRLFGLRFGMREFPRQSQLLNWQFPRNVPHISFSDSPLKISIGFRSDGCPSQTILVILL